MKGILALVVVALIAAAYIAGYWPEHQRLAMANGELELVREQLSDAVAHVRMCKLQSRLLHLIEKTEQRNYGEAQTLSTELFDQVRIEMQQNTQPHFQSALESALQMRDSVTAALTKGEPASLDLLQQMMRQFRQAVAPEMRSSPAPAETLTPSPPPGETPAPSPDQTGP